MAKAKKKKKSRTIKSRAKSAVKKVKKAVKKAVAKAKKAPARIKKAIKKAAPKKKKPFMGEGNYAASRAFDKDQTNFVKRNKAKIPAMGKAAEAALDGPEGDNLRAAEQEAMNRSVIE